MEALEAGAQRYLLKNIRTAELLDQLRGLATGEAAPSRVAWPRECSTSSAAGTSPRSTSLKPT